MHLSLEIYPDIMEIKDAIEGKDHQYTDDSEEIRCPICGAVWLLQSEDDVTLESCEHLRFTLHSDCEDFDFSGNWDSQGFLDLIQADREDDENLDIIELLENIKHSDIDGAMFFVWNEDPLSHPWTIWGYKDR
jgi:hypothetical protein